MATQELKFKFSVSEEGDIKIINRKEFERQMIENFKGKSVVGTFRKIRKLRSTRQNGFYWGITIPEILEGLVDCGYERYLLTPDNVHDLLKNKFLTVTVPSTEYSGEFITICKDSKTLSTGEWMDYTTEVYKWCQEFLNFTPSLPNEQKEMDLL